MKKCSYCGRENDDDAENCLECGTGFSNNSEVENPLSADDEPIQIGSYYFQEMAQVAAASLGAEGIECWITSDDCGGMMPTMGSGGVKLFVHAKNVETAKEILRSQKTPQEKQDGEIPRDLPKPVIVAGIWFLYGSGLLSSVMLLFRCLNGAFIGSQRIAGIVFSICWGIICSYLLYRSVKNYQIQKQRREEPEEEEKRTAV